MSELSKQLREQVAKIEETMATMRILRQTMWSILCQFKQAKSQFEQRIAGEAKVQALRKAIENLGYAGEKEAAEAVNDTLVSVVERAIGLVELGEPYQYLNFLIARTEAMYNDTEYTLKQQDARVIALAEQITAEEEGK